MRYDDAIELTQQLARTCRIPGLLSKVWGSRIDASEGVINIDLAMDAHAKPDTPDAYARRKLAGFFDKCVPYFLDARLLEMVETQVPSVPPNARLAPHLFKTEFGCLFFDRPVRGMPDRRLYVPEPDDPVRKEGGGSFPMFEPAPMSGFAWQTDPGGVILVFFYSWGVDSSTPTWYQGTYVGNVPLAVAPWHYETHTLDTYVKWHNSKLDWSNEVGDHNNAQRFEMSARVCIATLQLMDQVLTVINGTQVDRHARKRAAKAGWTREPTVQVVTLRKVDAINPYAQHVKIDWTCRWHVAEHWRTLRRGTPDERRVKVQGYLKGPEGLPIKPPNKRVFAVVR